jgi:hypothetical protein
MTAQEKPEQTDEAIVAEVVDRVADKFPATDVARLTSRTRAALEAFSGAHVRTYLPVLVERRVVVAVRNALAPA